MYMICELKTKRESHGYDFKDYSKKGENAKDISFKKKL